MAHSERTESFVTCVDGRRVQPSKRTGEVASQLVEAHLSNGAWQREHYQHHCGLPELDRASHKLAFGTSRSHEQAGHEYEHQPRHRCVQVLHRFDRVDHYKTIYGDPADRINYPGWRASGSPVNVKYLCDASGYQGIVRYPHQASGVPFTDIIDVVQGAISGYVNNLDVGEPVSISGMIAAASTVPGVTSVTVTSPVFSSSHDLIAVNANEQAYVINPTTDITITLLT